jgi:thiamine biosynthesis protein ThiS
MNGEVAITVNGELRAVPAGISVAALLERLGLSRERVAVELDCALLRRALHASTELRGGERLEIVTLVGGG